MCVLPTLRASHMMGSVSAFSPILLGWQRYGAFQSIYMRQLLRGLINLHSEMSVLLEQATPQLMIFCLCLPTLVVTNATNSTYSAQMAQSSQPLRLNLKRSIGLVVGHRMVRALSIPVMNVIAAT